VRIPDERDVALAIEALTCSQQLDPDAVGDDAWIAVVVDVISGKQIAAALGLTQREAAGAAWINTLPVDVLIDAALGRIPPPMPDGRFRLELGPPGTWERVYSAGVTSGSHAPAGLGSSAYRSSRS
jgi:hypothetical protein